MEKIYMKKSHTLLLLVFLASINVVFQLDTYLPLCGLVADERMFQQMLGVGTLMVILDQHCLDETLKLLRPFLRLETRRRIAWN